MQRKHNGKTNVKSTFSVSHPIHHCSLTVVSQLKVLGGSKMLGCRCSPSREPAQAYSAVLRRSLQPELSRKPFAKPPAKPSAQGKRTRSQLHWAERYDMPRSSAACKNSAKTYKRSTCSVSYPIHHPSPCAKHNTKTFIKSSFHIRSTFGS